MTGIERLYKLIADIDVNADPELWDILRWGTEVDWDCEKNDGKTLGNTLAAIAIQIEREQGGRVSSMRVLAVVTDMERHCLGHEGMEDSPVARWARELREALGATVSRHESDGVANSPYDALRPEDREAITWVREHGGLDAVKRRWECLSYYADPVPRSCMEKRLARLQRQIDECHEALRRRNQRIEELGHRASDLTRENAKLRKRAMPEGCDWPRYESGEPVMLGDSVTEYVAGGEFEVRSVEFRDGATYLREGFRTEGIVIVRPGERVKRPAVLAADGEPLEVGQTVWDKDDETDTPLTVVEVSSDLVRCEYTWKDGKTYRPCYPPDQLTHERPVADTWERLEEEARSCTCVMEAIDLVRRCRALAERERGER